MSKNLQSYAQAGFTKSYRKKWFNPVFRNLLEAGIWSWMCDTAVWENERITRFNNELITLNHAELVFSERFVADAFCYGRQAVRTFLANLLSTRMITRRLTHRATILTICNYDIYQGKNIDTNPQDEPQANPQLNQKLRIEESKKDTTHYSADARSEFQKVYEAGSAAFLCLATSQTTEIPKWIANGCSPELDIIPEIERHAKAGKNVKSWKFFTDGIMDAKATRERPLPAGKPRKIGLVSAPKYDNSDRKIL